MTRRYYVRKQTGPFDLEVLRSMLRGGMIDPEDEISPDDGETWVPVRAALALGNIGEPAGLLPSRGEDPIEVARSSGPVKEISAGDEPAALLAPAAGKAPAKRERRPEREPEPEPEAYPEPELEPAPAPVVDAPVRTSMFDPPPPEGGYLTGGRTEPTPLPPSRPHSSDPSRPAYPFARELTPLERSAETLLHSMQSAESPESEPPSQLPRSWREPFRERQRHAGAAPPHVSGSERSESSEWSSAGDAAFFSAGERPPPSPDAEDSLFDLDDPIAARRRRRRSRIGWTLGVLLVAGAGVGGYYMYMRSGTPRLPSERLAERRGADSKEESKESGARDSEAGSGTPAATAAPAAEEAGGPPSTAAAEPVGGTAATAASSALSSEEAARYAKLVVKGNKQLRGMGFGGAIKTFKAALKIDPNGAVAHAGLAAAFIEIGRSKQAAAAATRALELDAALSSPHRTLGLYLHEAGKKAEACEHYKRYLEKSPPVNLARETKENMSDLRCK